MFSTDFTFRQQENLVDNQKCQAGFRPLCNKIPLRSNARMKKQEPLTMLIFPVKSQWGLTDNG